MNKTGEDDWTATGLTDNLETEVNATQQATMLMGSLGKVAFMWWL